VVVPALQLMMVARSASLMLDKKLLFQTYRWSIWLSRRSQFRFRVGEVLWWKKYMASSSPSKSVSFPSDTAPSSPVSNSSAPTIVCISASWLRASCHHLSYLGSSEQYDLASCNCGNYAAPHTALHLAQTSSHCHPVYLLMVVLWMIVFTNLIHQPQHSSMCRRIGVSSFRLVPVQLLPQLPKDSVVCCIEHQHGYVLLFCSCSALLQLVICCIAPVLVWVD
jgi:hypothetical protein